MKEKDLRRLSRADLLEMLIDQSEKMEALRQRLETAEAELKKREIIIGSAGSIAEASLRLNGVFEAAQAACEQYIENVRLLNQRQDAFYRQFDADKTVRSAPVEFLTQSNPLDVQQPVRHRRTRRLSGM